MQDKHEFYCFMHPELDWGWNGSEFVDDSKGWMKWHGLDDFGDFQVSLSALDIQYRTCLVQTSIQEILSGPDKGKWEVVGDIYNVELHWIGN